MAKHLRALIIDDSEDDAFLLARGLRRGGFDLEHERVDRPEAMQSELANHTWDVVISDYSMPHFDGLAALSLLRETGLDIPFILVSGTIGEELAVEAMKAGAHDYVMKGNLVRLATAIERELREVEVRRSRKRAEEESRLYLERVKILHEIDLAVTSTLELPQLLNVLLEKIEPALPSVAMTIELLNNETGALKSVASRNINEPEWHGLKRTGLESLARIVVENRVQITVSNIQADARCTSAEFCRKEGLVSYIGVPLIAKDEVLGLIAFYTRQPHSFRDDELEFLATIANQAAIGIHNSKLFTDLKQKTIELERSNQVKDEFLSVISHELRTPLSISMGYTHLVKDGLFGPVNNDQNKALDKALKHNQELAKTIDAVLSLPSLQGQTVEIQLEEIQLREFLDGLKAIYAPLVGQRLNLHWDCPANVPVIRSDQKKLGQVVQTLIDNAIKFTDHGDITVAVRYLPGAGMVELKVTDTGVGIPKGKFADIFEMFRQADSSRTRRYEGVGLGLFFAKKFIQMLGGAITVESEIDKGSTFTVTIPVETGMALDADTCEASNVPAH
ncbi:MAG TPA: ATP-binding protein [Candidatus Binatia bacterium]|nr:ATP-binding protein [Candidatus Binatia bacterium]